VLHGIDGAQPSWRKLHGDDDIQPSRGLHGGGGIADTGFMSVMPCMVSDGMLARSKVSLPWMALLAEKSL